MKFFVVSSLLLLSVTGCWATFLHPFAPFGLQPPQQQFFYPPQRNIAHEQFLLFPQLRNHFPSPYQSFNYIQTERHPFNFYNAPAAPRFPLYPNYRQPYNPVVQYIYQQTPLVSVQSNTEYGEKVPELSVKNCDEGNEMPTAPAIVNRDPEMLSDSAMNGKMPEMQMDPKIVRNEPEMQMDPKIVRKEPEMQMDSKIVRKESEMQMVPEITNKEPEMQVDPEMISKEPEMPLELEMPMEFLMISKEPAMETEHPMINKKFEIPAEFLTIDKSSEESISDQMTKDATNPMKSQSETKPTESADNIAEQSTEVPVSDATSSTEEILAESTTLA